MNTLDIIVLFLVLALGIKGFLRGLVREIAGLFAIVGGIFVASRFSSSVSDILVSTFHMKTGSSANVLAFIVVFAVLWFAITFAASLLSKAMDLSGLGIANKGLGFAAAAGKIFFILSIIGFAVSNIAILQPKLQHYTTGSLLYPSMVKVGGFIMKLKPDDLNASTLSHTVTSATLNDINAAATRAPIQPR